MLTYQEFKDTIKQHILEYMPNEHDSIVSINEVRKNNAVTLDGLVVRKPTEVISPTIYLEDYYKDYKAGLSVENCMHKIAVSIDAAKKQAQMFDVEKLMNYEEMKSHLYTSVINYQSNEELLKQVPYEKKGDLAIVVRALVSQHNDENASYLITENILEKYHISKDQLFTDAYSNAPKLMPYRFMNMSDILRNLDPMIPEDLMQGEMQMFVLTNESGTGGASAMYYPGVMDMIHEKMGDIAIIPSSVHEVIVVPANSIDANSLTSMICEVNETMVDNKDILGSKALTYDSVTKEILNLDEHEKYIAGIKKDIIKSGFKPTDKLIKNIRKINHLVGETQGIADLHRLSKEAGKIENHELSEAVQEAAAECKAQELAAMQHPEIG